MLYLRSQEFNSHVTDFFVGLNKMQYTVTKILLHLLNFTVPVIQLN